LVEFFGVFFLIEFFFFQIFIHSMSNFILFFKKSNLKI
jgi:hypothetical protein